MVVYCRIIIITKALSSQGRISLARAVYREADIYLLDDPLAAVDSVIGKLIFVECIQKFLQGKIVLLATHQLQNLSQSSAKLYIMRNGTLRFVGTDPANLAEYADIIGNQREEVDAFKYTR